jgi:hypothetical protein
MAVPTGGGTETLHSHFFEDVDALQTLIYGVQHHVYTVKSIIVYCNALDATTDFGYLQMKTYDNHGGASGQTMLLARFNIQVGETYVWNDVFSFNGYEPSGTAVMSAAVQILNAAQGGSADAELQFTMTDADGGGQDYDIGITYVDQDFS